VLNPKVAIFYMAFLPQFISAGDPVFAKSALLAGIHALQGIVWLSLITLALSRARAFIGQPMIQRRLEAASGGVLLGLGLKLATDRR
jgi:threonine/homoserine/homoserine lactone efflux protein